MTLDDLIDHWYQTDGAPDGEPIDLHDYLGMTWQEYRRWQRGDEVAG